MAQWKLLRYTCIVIFASFLFCASAYSQVVPHYSFMVNNDASSAECMSCHDGSVVHPVPICTGDCGYRDPHIIDTPYPPPDKSDAFRPPELVLMAGIRLPSGMVTCISCHNLLNPGRFHLATSNEQSRLCLACHFL